MEIQHNILKLLVLFCFFSFIVEEVEAQQDPQYTQYMYNTMSVNAGYAGTGGDFTATGLYRTQWVGVDGAPKTITFGLETQAGERVGLGLNIIQDELGPSNEVYLDGNFSYTIPVGLETNLSFGIKAGVRFLDVDFAKGTAEQMNDPNLENIDSKFLPSIGGGIFYHHDTKWYLGLSVPNIISSQHYDEFIQSVAEERLHVFLIGGYVFDLSENLKFKPAFLGKGVSGAPISVDLSANFLFNEKLTLGLAYRWNGSVSGLAGFQISPELFVGYAYDYATTPINEYTSGSHEIMLRFNILRQGKIKSPRFF
ncbi:type IX secretion system membrane protein PorP/SprF [Algibacter sp. TI.3.09]|uniref:PorP/SprF family type IX secretion system membrane protein n=1 Tax=Algibacter sp. TI.3.09 TaxID=3121298 RepID=UPI00311F822D